MVMNNSTTTRIGRRGGVRVALTPLVALVALILLLLLAAAPATAAVTSSSSSSSSSSSNRRALRQQSGFYHRVTDLHWRQTDFSVRNEQQAHMTLSALRRSGGEAHAANAVSTALLGSQNFEKRADTHTRNNLMMNLQRYAKPGQSGALGAVYKRIHPRTFVTGDKDTDFRNGVWSNVHVKETRTAQLQHEMTLGRARQAAYERYKRELTDVVPPSEGGKKEEEEAGR
jgi:hypothetical protein